jgi:hypothetical protein
MPTQLERENRPSASEPSGEAGTPGNGVREEEILLAGRIYDALCEMDIHAAVVGDPREDDDTTLIDGNFNLRHLARLLRSER